MPGQRAPVCVPPADVLHWRNNAIASGCSFTAVLMAFRWGVIPSRERVSDRLSAALPGRAVIVVPIVAKTWVGYRGPIRLSGEVEVEAPSLVGPSSR